MKILNWNVCAQSKKQSETIKLALEQEADIISLQEVSEASLQTLKEQDQYHLNYTLDSTMRGNRRSTIYLVTLSRYPVKDSGVITYFDRDIDTPFTKVFYRWRGQVEKYDALFTDILVDDVVRRIYNIHLSWPVGSSIRREQFSKFLDRLEEKSNSIICGDLNVTGGVRAFNLLMTLPFALKPDEIFFNERKWFDQKFEEFGLLNPFKNTPSLPNYKIKVQLDHILVPQKTKILDAKYYTNGFGSDHTPYMLEIAV